MTSITSAEWKVRAPRLEKSGSTSRVSCEVDGEDIWFESDHTDLTAIVEGFVGALLVPALEKGARFHVEPPVNAAWLKAQEKLFGIYRDWWFPGTSFPIHAVADQTSNASPGNITASCFTGGVDSFHTLIKNNDRIDALVFFHGFDIPLRDTVRKDAFAVSMSEVARQMGKQAIIVRSNLREHHIFGPSDWIKTHGAAIAAGAHVLSGTVGRLLIPASYYHLLDVPWGTHWDTDVLHSSGRIVFEHYGHTSNRIGKIRSVYRNPLFLKHVRVCWENKTPTGNCSRCEKCLRTMAALAALGVFEKSEGFDHSVSLVERLDALPRLPSTTLRRTWSSIYALSHDPELRDAIVRLLDRTLPGGGLDLPSLREAPLVHLRVHWNSLQANRKRRS